MSDTPTPKSEISDPRVQTALQKVPRHVFVPPDLQKEANDDKALPIGFGQTISQPYVVGLMTELLSLKGSEKILEIGTGSGYQTAILAELAREVYTIETIPELAAAAKARLDHLGYRNIHLRQSDGYLGWPEQAPFDAIIVTCAPETLPSTLVNQLKEEGFLVLPLGGPPHQTLYRMRKQRGRMKEEAVLPVRFVPMTHPPQER